MLDEAKELNKQGVSFDRMKQLGLEYRYMTMHLLGEISHEEMCNFIIVKSTQYAKRQRVWFKKHMS
jgi:tRNA dimethylallyltransferase